MAALTREQRKQDFNHVVSILEAEPQNNARELFIALTQNGKRSVVTILNEDRSGLKDLVAADADGNALAFDGWEVSEIINISRHAAHLREEKGKDFRLKDINVSLFKDFKLSPACTRVQYAQGDITRTPPLSLTSSHSPNLQQNRSCIPVESFKTGIKEIRPSMTPSRTGNSWMLSAAILELLIWLGI